MLESWFARMEQFLELPPSALIRAVPNSPANKASKEQKDLYHDDSRRSQKAV
jgi:hypothetical protein